MNVLLLASSAASETSEQGGGIVEGIVREFHLDWPLFFAQLVVFFIVILILVKFAFKPILEMLEKRRARIAEGEEKLKEIEQQLVESEKRTAEAIEKANADAKRLIEEAKESAANLSEQKKAEAVTAAQSILSKAEDAAKQEREQMLAELKGEFGRLVTATTSQVTGKVLTDDDQRRLNEEALGTLQNH